MVFELKIQQPDGPRDQRIRDEFANNQMSLSAFTHHCAARGFWTPEEVDAYAFRAQQNEIRRALKIRTENGLPFAGPTTKMDESGAPIWSQRAFWDLDDYVGNIRELKDQAETMIAIAEEMIREAIYRYGLEAVNDALSRIPLAA